ncbi:hypothetical protein [Fontibacillus sp. BL9]|uniref:hypothetical protein n=1 Tax=Fontibacillus sp. BL9 TaxID=3389971 RepID=UPI00397A6B7B
MVSLHEIFTKASSGQHEKDIDKLGAVTFIKSFGIDGEIDPHTIYCFLSLSCVHCIDLLPKLGKLNGENFVLITDGDENENKEIRQELNFSFPLHSYLGPLHKVNITKTPMCFYVSIEGKVCGEKFTPKITDILEMLKSHDLGSL